MPVLFLLLLLLLPLPLSVHTEDLGELSANPFNPDSTSNPFGAGSPFKPDGLNNPCWLAGWVSVPNWFMWQELTVRQVTIGAAAGSYSHIVLASIMHPDIQPLFPISRSNTLLQVMDVDTLQIACLVAGLAAIVLLGVRHLLRA